MKFLLALLIALASLGAQAQAQVPSEADAGRQLLVMLQLPKAHYRPDSAYAGSYGDGVGLQARKAVAEALARKNALELQSEWPMPVAGVDCFVMRLPAGDTRTPEQAAKAVSADARVAWAQAVNQYHAQGSEQEPLYPTQPAARQWHLADLHGLSTGKGVRVAVIDSGIEASHPDLAGQVALNENFVDDGPTPGESHGTAVAGIIAARADNHLGIAGIAPQARLLGLRGCWQSPRGADTLCNSLSLAKALHAAILQRAQIINMSLGGPGDRLLGTLIDQALDRGIAVVAAVGAEGRGFPASHPGVLAVGNMQPLPAGAVLAPGRDVPSTATGGGWSLVSGSSFSAAHASGLLALLSELGSGSAARPLRTALVTEPGGGIDSCASLMRRQSGGKHQACGLTAAMHTSQ